MTPEEILMRIRLGVAYVTALACAVLAVPPAAAAAKPVPDPLAKASATVTPAVVYVEVSWKGRIRDRITGQLYENSDWSVSTRCSGFAVSNDGYVVTASHCLAPAGVLPLYARTLAQRYEQSGTITAANQAQFVANVSANGTIESATAGDSPQLVHVQRATAHPGLTTGDALAAQVVDDQELAQGDVALLKVEKSNLPIAALNRADDPAVGTDVFAVGYPLTQPNEDSATTVARTGVVSAVSGEAGKSSLQTDAAVVAGMDGGPLANLNGEVVGMLSHAPVGDGPPSVAVSASLIEAELARHGVHNDLGKVDKDYRDGLDAYYAGHYSEAITKFDSVLALVPSHAQAQEYQQKAVTLRQAEGESTDNHLLLYVGAGIAILLVVAILFLMLRARRRTRHTATAATAPGGPIPVGPAVPEGPAAGPVAPVFKPATQESPVPRDRPVAGGMTAASFSASPAPAVPVAEPPAASAAPIFAEPVLPGAPVPASVHPNQAARRPLPTLVYCSNCGLAAAPGTRACGTCGQRFP
jgi:S1-C subfamily serine protease